MRDHLLNISFSSSGNKNPIYPMPLYISQDTTTEKLFTKINMTTKIIDANLIWDDHGQPHSSEFNDIYFSKISGLEEKRYVFLQHNNLAKRFSNLTTGQHFVIGEAGFGSGLNFLCAWQLFNQQAPINTHLHFISVEKYPFNKQDLQQALQLWPELAPLATELLAQYTAIHLGTQSFVFEQDRIILTLLIGDVHQQLPLLNEKIDAWFLDGFAPAKNPQMWNTKLFEQLARLSSNNTTFATFTCAGAVRRGLIDAGFAVERTTGFGAKREMLHGHYQATLMEASHTNHFY